MPYDPDMTTSPMEERRRAPKASRLLAAEIRAEMGRQDVSKRELARRLNVTDMWVGRRLTPSSSVPITLEEVVEIAEALGVSPEGLLRAVLPRLDSNQQPSGYASAQVIDLATYRTHGRIMARVTPFPRPEDPVEQGEERAS